MLRRILFIIFITFTITVESAGQKLDSLIQQLSTNLPDSQKIKILNSLAFTYSDMNLDSAEIFSNQAIGLMDKISNQLDKANALGGWSIIEKSKGNYAVSLSYSYQALKICTEISDTLCMSALVNNMALTYNLLGDYGAAVDNLLIAIDYDEARKDTLGLGIDYINLGYAYYESKSYDKALEYAKKALEFLLSINDQHSQTYAIELLASIHLGKGEPDIAKPLIDESLHLARETKNEYSYQNNLKQLGDYHFQKESYDSAQHYYTLSMESNAENSYSDNLLLSTVAMARCYFAQHDFTNAMATAEMGYQQSLKGKNKNFTQEICALLGDIYLSANNLERSNYYLKLSSLYKDSIMNQSIAQSLESRMIQSRLTKEQNEKKVMALTLQQKEEQLYWQGLIILFVGIALLSITVVLLIIRKTNLVRKRINGELKQKNDQLENLNREINGLVQTIIHDLKSPFNTLQGIFGLMEMEKTNSEIHELLTHGRKAVTNGQEIIQQLLTIREAEEDILKVKNTTFESKSLVDDVVGDYTTSAKAKEISLDVSIASEDITTDRVILRRVLDNLLSNAIKFTPHEGRVTITSKKENGVFILEITDNGPGFSSHDMNKIFGKFQRLSARPTGGESSNGLGLAIVDILLKKLGGTISLKTDLGKGAHFTVKIPS